MGVVDESLFISTFCNSQTFHIFQICPTSKMSVLVDHQRADSRMVINTGRGRVLTDVSVDLAWSSAAVRRCAWWNSANLQTFTVCVSFCASPSPVPVRVVLRLLFFCHDRSCRPINQIPWETWSSWLVASTDHLNVCFWFSPWSVALWYEKWKYFELRNPFNHGDRKQMFAFGSEENPF